jgi:hypothetical protein
MARIATEMSDSAFSGEPEQKAATGELAPYSGSNEGAEDVAEQNKELSDEAKVALQDLCKKYAESDLYPRRWQLMEARKARYFWKGLQRILWDARGQAWRLFGDQPASNQGNGNNADHSDLRYDTNIYFGYGRLVIGALSANNPTVRFEPQNPKASIDIKTAAAAEKVKRLIERNNKMRKIQHNLLYYLWTDGVAYLHTEYVIDGQKFGYEEPETGETPTLGERTPKGQEVIKAYGTLEVKVPILINELTEAHCLALKNDVDITIARAKFPKVADKIVRSNTIGAGQSEYERIARVSTKQGTRVLSQSSDTMIRTVEELRYWLRPCTFTDIDQDDLREELLSFFPDGCAVTFMGDTFCEAKNEKMDDHWTMVYGTEGDGNHRIALGGPLVSLQERLNDLIDLAFNTYNYTIPMKWVNQSKVDLGSLASQKNAPGEYQPVDQDTGVNLASYFFIEPTVDCPASLIPMIQELKGDIAQFLCGAFPALFGGDVGNAGNTMGGMTIQKNQALGVQGTTWQSIKEAYASCMKQAVVCAANSRKDDIAEVLPGNRRQKPQPIEISLDDMQGNVLAFPDVDDNFPESWADKKAQFTELVIGAKQSPELMQELLEPDNIAESWYMLGLENFTIPEKDSRDKQLAEIDQMLQEPPNPNPMIEQIQTQLDQIQQASEAAKTQGQQPDPQVAVQAGTLLTQLKQIQQSQPLVTSITPDPEVEDHEVEAKECKRWLNSPEGVKAKAADPNEDGGYTNVRLHFLAHEALAKAQATNAPAKPPTISLSGKLPPDAVAQAAAQQGIQTNPASVAAANAPRQPRKLGR